MNISSSKKKTLKISLFFITLILLMTLVGGYEFVKSRVPQMSGEQQLIGLAASAQVIRDQNGVVHIEAKNNKDAFRALGYVMASERLFQMEISRRLAQGELAEILGKKALASDKLFRNLSIKRESQKIIERSSFDPELLEESNAFYEGVNQFIATGSMPIEFLILGIKPRPFSMVDGISFVGLMGFSFGIAPMTEPLLSKLVTKIGGDLTEDLRNEKIPFKHSRVVKMDHEISKKTLEIIADLENGFPLFEGSNGWLLSGKRTTSGFPILANDPHITYSHPGIWFEARIKTPQFETYGHFLPLIPFPILAHNRDRAWGLTMSLADDMDIYRETISADKKTYRFKGQDLALPSHEEVIKIKDAPDYKMTVYKTHHGPVMDHAFSETSKETSLSLQWAFYDEGNDPFSSIFKMGRASNMQEFKAAVATGKAPGLNILYADKTNIGWWVYGEIWKKRPGIKTDFVLDGESGKDEILSSMSFAEKPHLENPESGVIVSANTRPASLPKYLRGDWQPDDRFKTLEKILSQKLKWSPEETMELQSLNMNFENKLLLEVLLKETLFDAKEKERYQKHLDLLMGWDLNSEIHSIAPSLYYTWSRELQKILLKELDREEQEVFAKVPNGWIFYKRVVLDRDSPWWRRYDRQRVFKDSFVKSVELLEKKFGSNVENWRWGKMHTLEFMHPIGRLKPLNYIFNLGPYPVPGATHEINNQKVSTYKDDFPVKAGPSTRRVIDFAHPEKAWGILPTGNSGHLLSPFYSNQVQRFLSGKYREELMDLSEKEIRYKMLLTP